MREHPAHDRRALDHGALVRAEAFETRRQERLDRGGDRHRREVRFRDPVTVVSREEPGVDHHREGLLDEQGIALGRLRDPRSAVLLGGLDAHQVRDQPTALVLRERLQMDRGDVELAATPGASLIQQLRACQTHEQDRRIARPVGDVLDQIQERGLRPVDVLEHQDHGGIDGQTFDELAERPEDLLGGDGRLAQTDQLTDAIRDQALSVVFAERGGDPRPRLFRGVADLDPGGLPDDVARPART